MLVPPPLPPTIAFVAFQNFPAWVIKAILVVYIGELVVLTGFIIWWGREIWKDRHGVRKQ